MKQHLTGCALSLVSFAALFCSGGQQDQGGNAGLLIGLTLPGARSTAESAPSSPASIPVSPTASIPTASNCPSDGAAFRVYLSKEYATNQAGVVSFSDNGSSPQLVAAVGGVSPSFAPARNRVFFIHPADEDVYSIAPDGSGQASLGLIALDGPVYSLAISRDGNRIAFSTVSGSFTQLTDGTGGTQAIAGLTGRDQNLIFSPDGLSLIFRRWNSAIGASAAYHLYRVNLDGTNLTQLTFGPVRDVSPHFNLDGSRIIFSSNRSGGTTSNVYSMNADGTDLLQLTTNNRTGVVGLLPNGKFILLDASLVNDERFVRVDADFTAPCQFARYRV